MTRQSIVITGASDGIGQAVAWEMAKRGYDLGLTARRLSKLEQTKKKIEEKFPCIRVSVFELDVTEHSRVSLMLDHFRCELDKIDILMVNAGIAISGRIGVMPLEDQLKVIDTNLSASIAVVSKGIEVFREQGAGHVVATSSIAGFLGLPRNAAYSASKAALSIYMEALRAETIKEKIDVTVVNPGYIDTAINRGMASRPFVINVEEGARQFANAIERKAQIVTVPGFPWRILGKIMKVLPVSIVAKM